MSQHDQPDESNPADRSPPNSDQIQHSSVAARVPEHVGIGVVCTSLTVVQTQEAFVLDFLATMVHPARLAARVIMAPQCFYQLAAAAGVNLRMFENSHGPARRQPPSKEEPPQPAGAPTSQEKPAPTSSPASESHHAAAETTGASGLGTSANGGSPADKPPADNAPQPPSAGGAGESRSRQLADMYDQLKAPDSVLAGAYANTAMIRHDADEFAIDFISNFFPHAVVSSRIFIAAGRMPGMLQTLRNAWEKYQSQQGGPDLPDPAAD